jgi:hypothetical protein
VGFEKSLLTGVRERAMEGASAGHTPHAKQISLLPRAAVMARDTTANLRYCGVNVW